MNGGEAGEIGLLSWFLLILFGTLIIAAVMAAMWWFGMPYGIHREVWRRRKALRLLEERYARGEIAQSEYDEIRRELESEPPGRPKM